MAKWLDDLHTWLGRPAAPAPVPLPSLPVVRPASFPPVPAEIPVPVVATLSLMPVDLVARPSAHFTWLDTFHSDTATARGIQNDWRIVEAKRINEFYARIRFMCAQVELVRDIIGEPITPNSFYRCPALNKAVGGVANSAHLEGLAIDFTPSGNLSQRVYQIGEALRQKGVLWDQLLIESNWIHFSPAGSWDKVANRAVGQRCQIMKI